MLTRLLDTVFRKINIVAKVVTAYKEQFLLLLNSIRLLHLSFIETSVYCRFIARGKGLRLQHDVITNVSNVAIGRVTTVKSSLLSKKAETKAGSAKPHFVFQYFFTVKTDFVSL